MNRILLQKYEHMSRTVKCEQNLKHSNPRVIWFKFRILHRIRTIIEGLIVDCKQIGQLDESIVINPRRIVSGKQ